MSQHVGSMGSGPGPVARLKNFFTILNRYKYLYLLMAPGIIWYVIYKYIPMYGLIIAFKNFNFSLGILNSPWAGLKHFVFLFSFPDFYAILRNTILINFYNLVFGFPIPIILALLLNELTSMKLKRTLQTVFYFPHFLSWVVFGGIIIQLLGPGEGLVNQIIKSFGGEPVFFMAKPEYFRGIVVISSILKEAGWGAIVYLAALTSIDLEQYEAATVDGVNRWQKLIYITLPGIANTIVIMFILKIGYLLDVAFEQIYILYNPMVYEVGDVLSTYIYRVGLQGMKFSMTTAIGLFQSVIGLILVLIANKLAKKYSEVSLW
jgi:putative aldouronate transport system permease protein